MRRSARRIGTTGAIAALLAVAAVSTASFSGSTSGSGSASAATGFAYSTVVAADTPWLWWRLGETSTTTAADASGNARTGTVSRTGVDRGTVGAIPGDANTAYTFDGTSGCITSAATHANPTTLTLEIWFRTTSTVGGPLIGFDGSTTTASGTTTRDRQLFLTANGWVAFGVRPSSNTSIVSTASYNDGNWHLAHATLTPSATTLFVDGRQVASGSGGSATTTLNWHVGCFTVNTGFTGAPTTGYFVGELDEAAVYTTALSAASITKRWSAVTSRQPFARAVQSSSPWAWWRLGESSGSTTPDASGGGRALAHNSTGVSGDQSAAIPGDLASRYDGAAGCSAATSSSVNPTTFSLAAWFNSTAATGGPIIGFNDGSTTSPSSGTTRDRHVYLTPTGNVVFGVLAGGTPSTVSSTDAGYNDGAWHHVVATLGPAGQSLYVDGVLQATSAVTTAASITGYWHVGCQTISAAWTGQPANNWFAGRLDEVAVWTVQLDPTAVTRLFRAAGPLAGATSAVSDVSPWSFWRFGEPIGRYLTDSSGNSRSAITSTGGLSRTDGIVPGSPGISLDGASGCIVGTTAQTNPAPFSLEVWFRTTTTTGGTLIEFATSSTPNNTWSNHDRRIYMRDDGRIAFGTWVGSMNATTSDAAFNDGRWHHAVATLGATGTRLYVDGVLRGSTAVTLAENTTGYWRLGCSGIDLNWPGDPSSTYFQGDLDEVAVYSTVLSPATVRAHHRSGLSDGSMQAVRLASAVAAAWSLEDTSGTTLTDATGGSRPLTASASGLTYSVPGVSGASSAITFDGSNGCAVDGSGQNPPPTRFTVEAWVRTTSNSGGGIVGMSSRSTPDQTGATASDRNLYVRNDGRVSFGINPGAVTAITSTVAVNDGVWHHVAATLGPTGMALYIDGALAASSASSSAGTAGPSYWHVGCASLTGWPSAPTSGFLAGSIDEVAIYDQVLDASTLATRAAIVDQPRTSHRSAMTLRTPGFWWRLEETSGNAADSSGNGVTGTASGSGITRQAPGAVDNSRGWQFNGSSGCLASSSSVANPTVFTVEAWFRTESTTGAGLFSFTNSSSANNTAGLWDRHLYMTNAGTIRASIFDGGARPAITSSATYNDGLWHHVALTVGPAGSILYADGIAVASMATNSVENFTGWWHAGCGKYDLFPGAPTSPYLNGWLDEVAMHPVQLSPASVKQRFLAGQSSRQHVLSGTSIASTVAGTGSATSTGDGGASGSATVNSPRAVATDPTGNVYVGEGCRVRRIAPNGVISTFAGTGTCGTSGDGGQATSATVGTVSDIAFGSDGSAYLADPDQNRVRRVAPNGVISTFAGTGGGTTSGNGGAATSAGVPLPYAIESGPDGALYIATDNRVRRVGADGVISTFAGTGTASSTGDGGAATSATFNLIGGLAFEPSGSLLVTEYNGCRIRRINTSSTVSTVAGNGSCAFSGDNGSAASATVYNPVAVVVDAWGNVFFSELNGNRVRRISAAGIISTVAGNGAASSGGDGGAASSAQLNVPWTIALDGSGRLLVAENFGHRIRRIG